MGDYGTVVNPNGVKGTIISLPRGGVMTVKWANGIVSRIPYEFVPVNPDTAVSKSVSPGESSEQ